MNQNLIKIQYDDKSYEFPALSVSPYTLFKQISEKANLQKSQQSFPLLASIFYQNPEFQNNIVDPDQIEEDSVQMNQDKWQYVDLQKPIMGDCQIKFLTQEDNKDIVQNTLWHSSAHILGAAIEEVYDDSLMTMGPAIKEGFFYDFHTQSKVTQETYNDLQKNIDQIIKKNHKFERLEISKEEALDLIYKIGEFIDLCTGPHLSQTGQVKAFKITKHSSAYWLGDQKKESLQRVYGISFLSKDEMKAYEKAKEAALKNDHRNIGQDQSLFFFNKFSPGSAFFLSHGAKIYNKLVDLMRNEYLRRGYQEVLSPNLYHIDLWKVSGHYRNYKENLFLIKNQDHEDQTKPLETYGLKPMNCPGHCLIFKNRSSSYKELPIRYADFGVLHRNEISGALTGLTRVRRFQQDDAHIFCRKDQIEEEIEKCLDFLNTIYSLFGFNWQIFLSTRPESSMGSDQQWQEAELQLTNALNKTGKPWKLNKGDGAFYGPKIDIIIQDSVGRDIQCGTIQLDFQLPIRFNLQYSAGHSTAEDNSEQDQDEKSGCHYDKTELAREVFEPDEFSSQQFVWEEQPLRRGHERPVIIHRAILGSVERFIAIITEHLAGKWPIWLSPRQIQVCSVSEKYIDYSALVYKQLKELGYEVELDVSNTSVSKKVRNAQLDQSNLILIVGEQEENSNAVDIRTREGDRLVSYKIIIMFKIRVK
ncbi:threonyl-trna [Stylonychia lemnae]|uniref:threonine--tRNA ligase n=1 Tax=Stylonychia lemnae TaxID=5949 RepID=A0A078ARM8_STYLE|nr:threonyl-trna [Stylonychia lemnae]|eukprot:CDW83862.1 threonyl-trna [Stylonychia lemnae]